MWGWFRIGLASEWRNHWSAASRSAARHSLSFNPIAYGNDAGGPGVVLTPGPSSFVRWCS